MLIKFGRRNFRIPDVVRFTKIPLTLRLRNLPVFLAYNIVPCIAAICILSGWRQPEYELLWGGSLLLLLFSRRSGLSRWAYTSLRVILLMIVLKYILPLSWVHNASFKAMLIDFKWIYYLLWAILWVNFAGKTDLRVLYRCGRNMALGYCLFVMLQTIIAGGYSRQCTYLFGECNYVCYLMLIPYCFIRQMKGSQFDHLVFLLAVFLSDSRTGLASAVAIAAYPFYRQSRHKWIYWLGGMVFAVAYVRILFVGRGHSNVESVDRVMFLMQFLRSVGSFNLFQLFFGISPGESVPLGEIVGGFAWHINVFENMHGIKGCYPFYFHSTYMRLFLVWGLPVVVWGMIWVVNMFRKTRSLSLRRFIILFLMESVSLSTLSLTNVSVIFFLVGVTLLLTHGKTAKRSLCFPRNRARH